MLGALSRSTLLLGIATILNYGSFIIFARVGGPETFSQYLYGLTIATALSIVVNYSSQRVFTRDVLDTKSEQRSFNGVMTIRLIFGTAGLAGLILWGYWDPNGTPLAAVFLVFYIFQLNFLFEYFATNERLAAITLVEKAFFCIAASGWALTVGFTWHIYGFFLLGSLLALVLQARQYSEILMNFRLSPMQDVCRYAKLYFDLVLIDIVQLTYGNFSRIIIQQKNGLLDFGVVSISFQIIKIASIFQTQVEYIFRPQTIRFCEAGDLRNLKHHAFKYCWMTTLPTLLGSVLLIILAGPIVMIGFGKEYASAIPALQTIAILPVVINLMRFVEMIFIGLSMYRTNLKINLFSSVALLIGLLLIPSGSAISLFLWLIVAIQIIYVAILTAVAVNSLRIQKNRKIRNEHT